MRFYMSCKGALLNARTSHKYGMMEALVKLPTLRPMLLLYRLAAIALVTGGTILLESIAKAPMFHFTGGVLSGVSIFFPPTAWAIICFCLFGFWAVVGLVLGIFFVPWSPNTSFLHSFNNGIILSLEGLLPYLVLLSAKADVSLRKHKTLLQFLTVGLLGGTLANSVIGSLYQLTRYPQNFEYFTFRWFTRWTSDLVSAFILALPLLLLLHPLIQKLPMRIRQAWFSPIHMRPAYAYAIRMRLSPRELGMLGLALVACWMLFLVASGISFTLFLSWFAFLFIFPVVYTALKGGFRWGVYGASLTSFSLLILLFVRGVSDATVPLLFTVYLNLLVITLAGLIAGIMSEENAYRIMEIRKLQEFASKLVSKKAAPEVLKELAGTLLDTLHIKAVVIRKANEDQPQVFPEGASVLDADAKAQMQLRADGVEFGSLTLVREDGVFTRKDLDTAETVAKQAAIVLDNTRLYENLEYRVKELKALFDVAKSILVTLDLNELLHRTVQSLTQAFHLSVGVVFLKDPQGDLILMSASGLGVDAIPIKKLSANQGIIGRCFSTGRVQYSADVFKNPDYIEVLPGIHSELAVPLVTNEGNIGVLNLESYLPDAFRAEDIRLIKAVAAQLALAISQIQLHKQLAQAHTSLKDTYFETIQALSNAVEAKDQYTQGHVERTATFALEVGIRMGLPEEKLDTLRLSAMLHDIGKIGIPEDVLQKPGFLTPAERELMKKHVEIGVQILQEIDFLRPAIPGILHHQEWFDGCDGKTTFGYPTGARGDAIPIEARIICTVDSFDAMTSSRPYRNALGWDEAVKRLIIDKGRQFDPKIVDIFIEILQVSYNYQLPDNLKQLMELPPLKGQTPASFGIAHPSPPPLS
jgi:HD-GYP domain-containing protein (c-di-GMP phosphodiesterase class II)